MRFHHSTRRGRPTRLGGAHPAASGGRAAPSSSALRWAQLNYCRQTNIHFNRRLPVEPPAGHELASPVSPARSQLIDLHSAATSAPSESVFDYGNPAEYRVAADASAGQLIQGQDQQQQQQRALDLKQFESQLKLTSEVDDEQQQQSDKMTIPFGFMGSANSPTTHKDPRSTTTRSHKSPTAAGHNHHRHQQHKSTLIRNDDEQTSDQNNNKNQPISPRTKSANERGSPARGAKGAAARPNGAHAARGAAKRAPAAGNSTTTAAAAASDASSSRQLDLELAREKLVAQVEKQPFWSNKAAKRMHLTQLDERRVFIYELISYCERRELEWRYEPYRGGLVAGVAPSGGVVPAAGAYGQPQLGLVWPVATPTATTTTAGGPTVGGSRSQPATPPGNWCPAAASATCSRLQVPDALGDFSTPTGNQLVDEDADQRPTAAPHANHKSPIKRSSSSAAASPIRAQAAAAAAPQDPPQQLDQQHQVPGAELVWSIEAPAERRPAPFTCSVHSCELPGSSFVKRCHGCQGRGRLKCTSCQGAGYEVCISCSGKGTLRALAGPSVGGGASLSSGRSGRGGGGDSGFSPFGGMWDSAATGASSTSDSPGAGRRGRDGEPGGVTSAGSSGGGGGGGWTSESCHFCHGAGQKRCWICAGRAYNSCLACASTGQLRCYLSLNISWLNHRDECMLNNGDPPLVPKDRLRLGAGGGGGGGGGLLLVDEVGGRWLEPVDLGATATRRAATGGATVGVARAMGSPSPPPGATATFQHPGADLATLATAGGTATPTGASSSSSHRSKTRHHHHQHHHNQQQQHNNLCSPHEADQIRLASSRLLERHRTNYATHEKLVRQRQRVTQIDCSVVHWEWKRRRGHFVIYGAERKVYIAKYPFKSICNIT